VDQWDSRVDFGKHDRMKVEYSINGC
jgi:hypothetical protein